MKSYHTCQFATYYIYHNILHKLIGRQNYIWRQKLKNSHTESIYNITRIKLK